MQESFRDMEEKKEKLIYLSFRHQIHEDNSVRRTKEAAVLLGQNCLYLELPDERGRYGREAVVALTDLPFSDWHDS